MPSTRVWNSGGAPKMSLLAMVAPPAAGADDDGVAAAALVAAAGADVVAAVAGVDAAAGGVLLAVAGVFFELLHAVAPRTSAKPVLAMRIALRFMSLLVRQEKGRAVEQSSSRTGRSGGRYLHINGCAERHKRGSDWPGGRRDVGGEAAGDTAGNDVALHKCQHAVGDECKGGDQHAAADHLREVLLGQPVVDETAEATEGKIRRDRGGRDDLQRCTSKAGEDQRQTQRKLDLPKHLLAGHAHRGGRVAGGAIDVLYPRVGVRENGWNSQQYQHNLGGYEIAEVGAAVYMRRDNDRQQYEHAHTRQRPERIRRRHE